jgi:hypothetical protein
MTIPRELLRSAPRDVRLSGGGRALAIFAFLLAVASPGIGVLLHMKAVRNSELASQRIAEGVTTTGRVTEIQLRKGDKNRSVVKYSFNVLDQQGQQEGSARMRRRELQALQLHTGDPIEIGYLPRNPADNWMVGREPREGQYWMGPIAGVVSLAIAGLLMLLVLREKKLLTYGRAAIAKAKRTKRIRHQHGTTNRVTFEFPMMSGAVRQATVDLRKPMAEGSEFIVVYNPDNPRRVAKYPFSLVQL